MARAATRQKSAAKTAPAVAAPKKLGRPLGSKNKVRASAAPARRLSSASAPERASTKAAPVVVAKMNKADLEAHIVKLERGLVRLRKQNAELKQAAADATTRAEETARVKPAAKTPQQAVVRARAKPSTKTLEKGSRKKPAARRGKARKVTPVEVDEPDSEDAGVAGGAATDAG